MKRKIYKGGVDNYPLWWYGQSNRLQNFGDRPNFLTPHGAVFQGNGYYFNSANSDYMEDIYGRHLFSKGTEGVWSYLYLTNSTVPPCGSGIGTGTNFYLSYDVAPKITGKIILYPEYCPNLINLFISFNKISTLDVSRLIKLVILDCSHNDYSTLDVSRLLALETLYCGGTFLHVLDIKNNSKIKTLGCPSALLDQSAVDKVLVDANAWGTSGGTLDISGNTAPSQTGIDAKNDLVNRNWTVTTD